MKVSAICKTVPIPCAPCSFHVRYRFPESASAWAAPFLVRSCAGLFPWPPGGSCAKGLCCSTVPGQGQSPQPTVLPEEGRFPHPAERVRQNFPWQAQGLPHSLRLPEGIRPAPLRQGNRPRLWLQSSVSSMCSRRASPGHAGALQVAGEAPRTRPASGSGLPGCLASSPCSEIGSLLEVYMDIQARTPSKIWATICSNRAFFLPHGPFTGKSTSVLPACSLGNTSPLTNALSRTVTLPQGPAFPCSPARQAGPASCSLDPQGGRAHFGPSFFLALWVCRHLPWPTHALANSSLKLRQGLAWPACTVSRRKAFRRKAFSCILEFPKLFPALVFF